MFHLGFKITEGRVSIFSLFIGVTRRKRTNLLKMCESVYLSKLDTMEYDLENANFLREIQL